MKASEIRDLGQDEALAKVVELKESLFNLRFQHAVGQLENTGKLKETRRDIARLETIIAETEANATNTKES
jgi:large subunit ribosomal protein L29